MGVMPVSNKYFTFDGETSKTYHTHITGSGTFNAPVRAVELVNIPNRNGAFALDKGYFENYDLTYKASIVADTVAEFSQAVSDLRNWLCSKKGYRRLEDDYNPNEYRMAVYKSGLNVEPFQATSGEFDIVFSCKPQRYLTSGETAVSVASGGTITNPTLFEAKPQLQVKGYGNINIDGKDIVVENVPFGMIQVGTGFRKNASAGHSAYVQSLDVTDVLTGDAIYSNGKVIDFSFMFNSTGSFSSFSITAMRLCTATVTGTSTNKVMTVKMGDCSFVQGTASTITASVDFSFVHGNTTSTGTLTIETAYESSTNKIRHLVSCTNYAYIAETFSMDIPAAYANSTKTATGDPLYIDLEIGEAWNEDSGSPLSVNNAVQLPAQLPTLASGANTITYDNTFTSFKVVPRWWRV